MSRLVEVMAALGGEDAGAPGAEVEMRQIYLTSAYRTYTSRDGLPGCGRETTGIVPFSPTKGTRAGGCPPGMAALQRLVPVE
jgi:hypothetical protein